MQKARLYRDMQYGLTALAKSRTMAWQLVRNKCHELNIEVPTMEKIVESKELEVLSEDFKVSVEGAYVFDRDKFKVIHAGELIIVCKKD